MKKSTINFIKRLLEDELDREIIQDNPVIEEVDYVIDLIDATKDFIKNYGEWFEGFYVDEKIEKLYRNAEDYQEKYLKKIIKKT